MRKEIKNFLFSWKTKMFFLFFWFSFKIILYTAMQWYCLWGHSFPCIVWKDGYVCIPCMKFLSFDVILVDATVPAVLKYAHNVIFVYGNTWAVSYTLTSLKKSRNSSSHHQRGVDYFQIILTKKFSSIIFGVTLL